MLFTWFLLLLLLVSANAKSTRGGGGGSDAAPQVDFFHGLRDQKSCFGSECFSTIYCHRGASFMDLFQVGNEVRAVMEFDVKLDASKLDMDQESDDEYSIKSLLFLHTVPPEQRLLDRKREGASFFSRLAKLVSLSSSNEDRAQLQKRHEFRFSPFGTSCFQVTATGGALDAERMAAISGMVHLESHSVLNLQQTPLLLAGALLLVTARRLSIMPQFYYLSGASLGVGFAVSVLVLCFFYLTSSGNREGARTTAHFGIAALAQAAALFMRRSIFDFLQDYLEYVFVYIAASFCLSLALIHYSLKTEDRGIVLNPALCDLLHLLLVGLGSGLMAFASTKSARLQLAFILVMVLYAMFQISSPRVISALRGGREDAPVNGTPQQQKHRAFSSPPLSRLQSPEEALDFIAQNHSRFVLRKLRPVHFDEYEEEEVLYDSSGSGSDNSDEK